MDQIKYFSFAGFGAAEGDDGLSKRIREKPNASHRTSRNSSIADNYHPSIGYPVSGSNTSSSRIGAVHTSGTAWTSCASRWAATDPNTTKHCVCPTTHWAPSVVATAGFDSKRPQWWSSTATRNPAPVAKYSTPACPTPSSPVPYKQPATTLFFLAVTHPTWSW